MCKHAVCKHAMWPTQNTLQRCTKVHLCKRAAATPAASNNLGVTVLRFGVAIGIRVYTEQAELLQELFTTCPTPISPQATCTILSDNTPDHALEVIW